MEADQKTISDQCRVVAHFARAIATIYEDRSTLASAGDCASLHDGWLAQSDDLMEKFGNILNGYDAVTDEDEWTFPIVSASVSRQAAEASPSARGA